MNNSPADHASPLGLFPGQPTPRQYDRLSEVLRTPIGVCVATGVAAAVGCLHSPWRDRRLSALAERRYGEGPARYFAIIN